jgi:hypothetical protein
MEKALQIAKISFYFALTLLVLSITCRIAFGDGPGRHHGFNQGRGMHGGYGKMVGHPEMMMFEIDDEDFDISTHLKDLDLPEDILKKIQEEVGDIDINIQSDDGEMKVIVKTIKIDDEK